MIVQFPVTEEQRNDQRRESELAQRIAQRNGTIRELPRATVLRFPLSMTRYADSQFRAAH